MKQSSSGRLQPDSRTVYLDYLRVFSSIAVIVAHVAAQNWGYASVNGYAWHFFNAFNCSSFWSNGSFVMISGILFLGREISIKKLYSKYILRMLVSFFTWSLIYAAFIQADFDTRVRVFLRGYYHMWFVLMMIGLYICLPLLKEVASGKRCAYYLLLSVLFSSVIPELLLLLKHFGNDSLVLFADMATADLDKMQMSLVLGYGGYFILGYCIHRFEMSRKQRVYVYALGLLGVLSAILLNAAVSIKTQTTCGDYSGHQSVHMLLAGVAVLVFFKYRAYPYARWNALVRSISRYSYGAFLSHVLVMEFLNERFGLNTFSFHPLVSVLLISALVTGLSYLISALLHCIPVVKRYCV